MWLGLLEYGSLVQQLDLLLVDSFRLGGNIVDNPTDTEKDPDLLEALEDFKAELIKKVGPTFERAASWTQRQIDRFPRFKRFLEWLP